MTDIEKEVEEVAAELIEEPETKDESTPEETTRARRMGWIDKDSFKGDLSKWRPAKEFLERGETELPLLRERYKKLDSALEKTQAKLSDIEKGQQEFIKFTRAAAKREYDDKLAELQLKKDEAFDSGDKDAFANVEKQITELEKKVPVETETKREAAPVEPPPDLKPWFDANTWYNAKEPEMQSYADAMGDHYKRTHNGAGGTALLDYVRKEVEKQFPEKFDNPARNRPSNVGGAGGNPTGSGGKKGHGFSDLSHEAQVTCNNLVRQGYMTKEEFLKDYDWS